MEVTILGCSGGYPGPGQAASGYLLTINDKKVLIDCGSGVFSNLQLHVPLNGLDAILIIVPLSPPPLSSWLCQSEIPFWQVLPASRRDPHHASSCGPL